ncbi:CpsD/CapB family tyrosine-protein kinase [Rhizobium sp. Root1220]|uniref:CpsD/CapB family tyrosine-protein kinase n=1 Tax=Rhizobium sp. Root1220 TaxID=1736432 RepID=UPI0006F280F6|nr:CpsD/CapB family tyrosine-protein kinase [Rhizobium sp. Root1220]KQV70304.1 chromosome partitioning protein [Rhizobium sp. Root1220]
MEQTVVSAQNPAAHRDGDRMPVSRSQELSQIAWDALSPLVIDHDAIARNRIVTANRSDTAHVAFDMLRTKLLQELRQNNWTSVAITSPTPGCGKTFVAANLAFSLANQKDCRTLLLDLDLRRPQVGKTLGIKNAASMESFLKGEIEVGDTFLRHEENLAIAANRKPAQFSAELLQSTASTDALFEMKQRMMPDIILFDLPPMLSTDDVLAFLPNVDCVILVAAAEHSTLAEVDVCEHSLAAKANVLGVVLNKCKFTPEKYGY